jgi:hypothetical protein
VARNSASGGGASSRFQRCAQNAAVAGVIRPGERAGTDRALGAMPANAAAHPSTACPVGDSMLSARP